MSESTIGIPSEPVEFFRAVSGVVEGSGQQMITIGFGTEMADSEFFALSIDDARRLALALLQTLARLAPSCPPDRQ